MQPLGTDNYVPTIMYTFVFGRYSLILSDYRSLSLIIHDFRLHHPILIVDSFGRAACSHSKKNKLKALKGNNLNNPE